MVYGSDGYLPNVAPQYSPTMETDFKSNKFAGTFSIGPEAKPTTTSLAPQFTHFRLGISLPTGSNTTSTPLPPVIRMTSFYVCQLPVRLSTEDWSWV